MKNIFIAICTLLSITMFAQKKMNEQLRKLFLDLDLTSDTGTMIMNSPLNFKYGVNKGIDFRDEKGNIISNNIGTYESDFTMNPFIESKIKKGHISILQNERDDDFSIHESILFNNEEDMIKEYYKILTTFEELGSKIKKSTIQDDNLEIKFESTEIIIVNGSKKSTLTISYSIPPKKENNTEYVLTIGYNKKDQ